MHDKPFAVSSLFLISAIRLSKAVTGRAEYAENNRYDSGFFIRTAITLTIAWTNYISSKSNPP